VTGRTGGWDPAPHGGRVERGRGEAGGFIRLPWVQQALRRHGGIEAYPGTLNLRLEPAAGAALEQALARDAAVLPPAQGGFCEARLLPLRLAGRQYAGALRPDVPGYDPGVLEIVSALELRATLALAEGQVLQWQVPAPLRPRAVVFDLDGTLVDSIATYQGIAEAAAAEHGIGVPADLARRALNVHPRNLWAEVVPASEPRREALMAALQESAMRLSREMVLGEALLIDGAVALIRALARAGMALGVVTSSGGQGMQALAEAGAAEAFEQVVTACEIAARKPAPDGLLACAEGLGVPPAETLYVGDAVVDVQAARAAGAMVAGVLCGAGSSADLAAAGADRLCADLAALHTLLAREGVLDAP